MELGCRPHTVPGFHKREAVREDHAGKGTRTRMGGRQAWWGGGMLMRKNEEVYWNFNYKDITLRT